VETIEELPVVDNGSDMFPSWGHVVDIGSAGLDSVVSASPASSRVILVVALTLAVLRFLGRAFVPADAHKLEDAVEKLDSFLEPSPKVACLVADCEPSVYDKVVALVEESRCPNYSDSLPGSSIDSEPPQEEEVGDVSFHREVETAITRLERLRLTLERALHHPREDYRVDCHARRAVQETCSGRIQCVGSI
jgi:hypothetical protein